MAGPTRARVLIIGAGFGGIGLGIRLKAAGEHDFIILEKSGSAGGVWAANSYPGAACDIPSHLYSFSFAPKPDWPQKYGKQDEILRYLIDCTRKHGLEPHLRLNTEASEARWDEASANWIVETRDGAVFEAQSLVSATGQLSRPHVPAIPGIENFTGPAFHSAEWRHDIDLTGKQVAVIGTGASAIQFIPEIAPRVEKLTVFQRSAPYVLPKADKAYPRWQQWLFRNVPGALALSRVWTYIKHEVAAFAFVQWPAALRVKRHAFFRNLLASVSKEALRQRLIPHYRIGCKRILISNDFYPAMNRDNVALVTEAIRQIRPNAVVTVDGIELKADVIIYGTGFAATDFLTPMKITGRDSLDLHQAWRDGAEAYLGITVAGFPNFFMLYGPNTNLSHNSLVYMIECEIRYVMACLNRLRDARTLEVRRAPQDAFNATVQRHMRRTVWLKGCTSWYLTADGRNTTNWPGYSFAFNLRTRAPKWDDYAVG